jgi:hypothetical protein
LLHRAFEATLLEDNSNRLVGEKSSATRKCREQAAKVRSLEHDPEKWIPVFRKDHAPPKI